MPTNLDKAAQYVDEKTRPCTDCGGTMRTMMQYFGAKLGKKATAPAKPLRFVCQCGKMVPA